MTIKVAINGYGRIGRNILRAHYEDGKQHDIQIVAINDLGNAETNAHLTRYDTAHGKFPGTVTVEGDNMLVNGDRIRVCAKRNQGRLVIDDHHRFAASARKLADRFLGGFSDFCRDRQPDLKAGARSNCGFDIDRTAEIGHDSVHQR